MNHQTPEARPGSPLLWILGFVLTAAALTGAGFAFYRFELNRIEEAKTAELHAVGSLKASQLEQWRWERAADAARTAGSPFLVEALERFLSEPENEELRADWVERLRLEQEAYDYAEVMLVAPGGEVLISSGGEKAAGPTTLRAIVEAIATRQPVHSELHRAEGGRIHLDTVAPVVGTEGRVLAVVVLCTDPERYLYPLMQSWPTPSPSAETVVVDWNEHEVRFLNRLRHRPEADPLLTLPRSRVDVIAVKAAAGARGIVRGTDYKGADVVADVRPIAGSNWMMIAKVDSAELFAEARRQAGSVGLLVVVGVLLAGSVTALGYRRQTARLHEVRSSILESAGEGIYGIDPFGHCTFVNRAAAELLGYAPHELIGRNMHRLIHDRHEDGRAYDEGACPINRAFQENRGCRIDNEVFWRKDGTPLPVDYSSHPILESGRTIGAVVTFRDVTERREAERRLRQREALLRIAGETAHLGGWALDLPERRLSWSDEVCAIHDLAPGEVPEALGAVEFYAPESRDRVGREFLACMEEGKPFVFESELITAKGRRIWVRSSGAAERNARGEIVRVQGAIQDITEQKQAQQHAERLGHRMLTMLESMTDAFLSIDREQRVTYMNREAEKLLERPRNELIGRNLWEAFPEAVGGPFERHYRMALQEGVKVEFEEFYAPLNRLFEVRAFPSEEGLGIYFRDITERKKSEEALREASARLRGFLDNSPLMISEIGTDGRYRFGNPAVGRLYSQDPEALIGRNIRELLPPEAAVSWEQSIAEIVETREPRVVEDRAVTPSGERIFVTTLFPLFDAHLRVSSIGGIGLEVTEQRRADEALRASQRQLSTAQRIAHLGSWEIDLARNHLVWSDETYGIFGIEKREFGQNFESLLELIHPEDRERLVRERNATLSDGRPMNLEYRVVRPDGSIRYVEEQGEATVDASGRVIMLSGTVLDITERREAEARLRENEMLVRLASQIARLGGWRVELPGAEVMSSDEMCDILEIPRGTKTSLAEAAGRYSDDSRERIGKAFAEAILHGTPIDVEAQLKTAKGRKVWVRTIGHALRDASGRIIRLQGATQDITDRKREEEALEKLEAQLRQAQKMEAVGRLAGGVAHDFNNMLTVIQGHSQLVLEDLAPDHPLRMSMEEIMEAARRSEELTRQLLAFARQQTTQPRVLDLNETIGSMLKMLGRLIGEHIELKWRPGADAGLVKIDPIQIDQILANLAVNARDAIGETGTLTIATAVVDLDEEFCESHPELSPGRYALLTVSDTGCGMTPEVRDQAFEPFFTTKEPGKGTGLGLATVYGILKQNHGHITVYSEPGQGTTFNIYLPQILADAVAGGEAAAPGPPPTGHETVLLVEDEPALLRLTRRMLEELGYTVFAASRPDEAIDLVKQDGESIDLLLTDVVMPRMSGRELLRELQRVRPELKCLFMSGYTADIIAHHGVLHEGLVFVQKPFSKQSLASKIREALSQN